MLVGMTKFNDLQIIDSWKKNVRPWVTAIREGQIASRVAVTNEAIVTVVLQRQPKTVLDIGCGEGWLVRELARLGINALGVDVVPEFIDIAKQAGSGRFQTLAYEEVNADTLNETFDVVVCNFSLLGKESVECLFQRVPSLLNVGGAFIVQTLHPVAACGEQPYRDGWREGSWTGFSDQFCDPAPWYFRTLETWLALYAANGFKQTIFLEPLNPNTTQRASVIFVGELSV
jgi:2-polyprenyl-3-methyl-5-hydroxy-6-metoxy-1,4-benzoquinol methylase